MSVFSATLECDKCDFRASFSVIYGIFNYLDSGKEYNVKRSYGWCFKCENFTAIEKIDDFEENNYEIASIHEKIYLVENANFWKKRTKEYKKAKRDYEFYLKHIEELKWRRQFLINRKTSPKCLLCGSEHVKKMNVQNMDYYDKGPDQVKSNYEHPGCGGNLMIVRPTIRIHYKYDPVYYDLNGNQIKR